MNWGNKARFRGNAGDTICVLAIVEAQHSAELTRIFSHTRWEIHLAHSVHEAAQALRSFPISVILCEHRLPDGSWRDVVREAEQISPRPPTVVMSATADPGLWPEVFNCGGYDLLMRPLDPVELYALVPMAWRQWKRASETTQMTADAQQPRLALAQAG
jgi:DNA-binding NtrC family response regulator